jgi:hypothetical protein
MSPPLDLREARWSLEWTGKRCCPMKVWVESHKGIQILRSADILRFVSISMHCQPLDFEASVPQCLMASSASLPQVPHDLSWLASPRS